jgi:hypothetical protein
MTFAACAERYIASHKAGWRDPKRAAQWPATLGTYVYPVFESLPVQAASLPISPLYPRLRGDRPRRCVAVDRLHEPGRLAEIRRRGGRLKLALRGEGATRPSRQTRWWRKEGSNRRPLSVSRNRNLGGGAVSKSVVLSPGDRGVRGHDVEPDVRARLDRRVVNRGIKREPVEAGEELRLDRLSFSDVPPFAMRRWRR